MPARIELGELERKVTEQINWNRTKNKLIQFAKEYFPDIAPHFFDKWLEDGKKKQIADSSQGYWTYLSGRVIAEDHQWDYLQC